MLFIIDKSLNNYYAILVSVGLKYLKKQIVATAANSFLLNHNTSGRTATSRGSRVVETPVTSPNLLLHASIAFNSRK